MLSSSASTMFSDLEVDITPDAPIGPMTWYGIGGHADILIKPLTVEALTTLVRRCRRMRTDLRVFGKGANLLVADDGVVWVVFVLFLVWATDIGAFAAGKLFGKIKLIPRVSPRKTWEGVIGGIVLAAIVAIAGAMYFQQDPLSFVSLCVAVSAISVVGDLIVSVFKRHHGLKDSGRIFPGHGGMLDRIDSICSAAPVFVLGLSWQGLV